MLIDLEEVEKPFSAKSTVCIAGGGIAGLVLATALADAGIDVHLLEAGGREIEGRSQSIYDAEMASTKHAGTSEGRFRVFGGTSTRWGGQILPYTDDVFLPPVALSTHQWPVTAAALRPFYRRVEELLGINNLSFDAEVLETWNAVLPSWLKTNQNLALRFSKWAPFSRRNLAQTLGIKAIRSGRISVFLHANVTECLLSPDGMSIEAFLVRNYRGTRFRFVGQQYVMATGTIETSRLLLASSSVCPRGVGNCHGQVGRMFHDHVSAPVATVNGKARSQLLTWLGPYFSRGTTHTGRFEATAELRRQYALPAIMAHLTIEEPEESGIVIARDLFRSIQRGNTFSVIRGKYRRLPAASLQIVRLGYHARINHRRVVSPQATVTLRVDCEQSVRSENRIRLSEYAKDALGIPKAIVDWRVSQCEIQSMRRYAQFLHRELNRRGLAAIDWHPGALRLRSDDFPSIRDTNHPMGGTMMGHDPRQSVVDDNLRVHGVDNLYIASCSTFPSGGSSNPTFTMMALAFRLSEQLTRIAGYSGASYTVSQVPSRSDELMSPLR